MENRKSTKILIAGDYCPIGRIDNLLNENKIDVIFNEYRHILENIDFSIVNLECPITKSTNKIKKTGPCIKSDNSNAIRALKTIGFDAVTLANNHILDYSGKGVLDTIDHLKRNDLFYLGAGKDINEARKPLIQTINNIKIGFINIAENEFCVATDTTPGAYTLDLIENLKSISLLKENVDKIILIYHGGREHFQLPTPELKKRLRFFIEQGIDAIITHHPHCIGGYEFYKGKPIVYSIGNFIFDYKTKYQTGLWTEGISIILKLEHVKDNFDIEIIPHVQGKKDNPALFIIKDQYKIDLLNNLEKRSEIIKNDEIFNIEWNKYIKTQEKFYLSSLYIKNHYLRALFIKGILPISILRTKHRILALNLMRCETHHEISKSILDL